MVPDVLRSRGEGESESPSLIGVVYTTSDRMLCDAIVRHRTNERRTKEYRRVRAARWRFGERVEWKAGAGRDRGEAWVLVGLDLHLDPTGPGLDVLRRKRQLSRR